MRERNPQGQLFTLARGSKRGEARRQVTATGQHTYFGGARESVKSPKTVSHLQEIIFAIVKYLVILDAVLVGALLVYAGFAHLPWSEVLPFAFDPLGGLGACGVARDVHGSDGAGCA